MEAEKSSRWSEDCLSSWPSRLLKEHDYENEMNEQMESDSEDSDEDEQSNRKKNVNKKR